VSVRRPRQRYFDREFHEALWHGFQALSAGAKRLVLAVLVVGALYAFSGGSQLVLWGATLVAALVLFLLHDPPPLDAGLPTEEELRALDRLRQEDDDGLDDEDDEWDELAAGNGHLEFERYSYEEALGELLRLVGHQVTVIVGAVSEARPAAMLRGRLVRGADVTLEGEEEVLLFGLDRLGSGFFMAPDRFRYAEPAEPNGLMLYIGDAVVTVRDEGPARERRALMHERRRRP